MAEAARHWVTATEAAGPAMGVVAITGAVIIGVVACPTEVPPAATVGMMAAAAMTGGPVTIMADRSRACV